MAVDVKKTKPLMSGFMKSTQVMELDGCTRGRECMKMCPTIRSGLTSRSGTHAEGRQMEQSLLGSQKGLRAKVLRRAPAK